MEVESKTVSKKDAEWVGKQASCAPHRIPVGDLGDAYSLEGSGKHWRRCLCW